MPLVYAEQLIYGLVNGLDCELRTTPHIHQLLTDEELSMLSHIGDHDTKAVTKRYWTDKWLAVSFIRPMKDMHGRRANWNHTFVMRMADYLAHTQPQEQFLSSRIWDPQDTPTKLEPHLLV